MRQQQVALHQPDILTHTKAIRQALKDGARVATMPGMTNEMFSRGGMSANFTEVKRRIGALQPHLRRRRILNVKSEQGTDVTFEVNWREWKLDDNGICNRPRMLTNLPAGKAFIMPREGTMNSKVVIDGSWESNLVDEPITLTIESGMVVDVTGGTIAASIRQEFGEAAGRLRAKDRENVWTVAEFGFGMNPHARLFGNVLEDEKRLGTCYFAVGDNTVLHCLLASTSLVFSKKRACGSMMPTSSTRVNSCLNCIIGPRFGFHNRQNLQYGLIQYHNGHITPERIVG